MAGGTSDTPSAAGSASDWFIDETSLLDEMRRARLSLDSTPGLSGYSGLRELERGGQGIVYSATQTSTRRTVAVKVLHTSSLDSASARRRFEREVELAATLNHPGVVRVFDSGSTSDGRLFLSMEFVQGETLDKVAIALRRDPKRIAELMAKVCDAVTHAHQRGVIHRDLKPSNIRVDADGTPRVLDFGLARTQAQSDKDVTTAGSFLGSLAWTSPEQARGLHDQVDCRSDIYSLGILLFHLLTGKFPYDVSGDVRTALEAVVSAEPARLRSMRPDLQEDLEVITAKCLAKDPAFRYQTAAELAEDLRNYLAGEPIRARRESMLHTMRRRMYRYRAAAWAAAIVALTVAASLVSVAISANRAARDRDLARLSTHRAETTVKFLKEMLAAADPDTAGGGMDVRVASLLDHSAANIDTEYADDPETLGNLHYLLGETYTALGLYDQADLHIQRAIEVFSTAPDFGPLHPRTLETRAGLADLRLKQSKSPEGEAILREVIPLLLTHFDPHHQTILTARGDMGMALRDQNKLDEAEAWYRDAIHDALPPTPTDQTILLIKNNLASLLQTKDRLEEAYTLYDQVLQDRIRLSGPDHAETITLRSNMATLAFERGHFAEAEPMLRDALAASTRLRGPDHPVTLTIEHNLAFAVENLGDVPAALALWRDVVERRERTIGPDHLYTMASMANLAMALAKSGDLEQAETMNRTVLERRQRILGDHHLDTLRSLNNLGQTLLDRNRPQDAEPLIRRAVDLSAGNAGVLPEGHWIHAVFQSNLGNCLGRMGRTDEAEALLNQAITTLHDKFGDDHPQTKKARANLDRLHAPPVETPR